MEKKNVSSQNPVPSHSLTNFPRTKKGIKKCYKLERISIIRERNKGKISIALIQHPANKVSDAIF